MKQLKEFINESLYKLKDVKDAINDELNKTDKNLIQKMANEIKDDIDDQDEYIEGNDESYIWELICKVAKTLNTKPENLWDDCGGSYLFTDAIANADKIMNK